MDFEKPVKVERYSHQLNGKPQILKTRFNAEAAMRFAPNLESEVE
jgi:hypothetical protein